MKNEKEYILREFQAEKDSFLIKLRIDFFWDHKKFIEILYAMKNICVSNENNELLERQIADGFWYFSFFVKDWSEHENFPKQYSKEYYELAYELIFLICNWYFTGNSPFNIESGFSRKINNLNKVVLKS